MLRVHLFLAIVTAGLVVQPNGHAQAPKAIVVKAPGGAQIVTPQMPSAHLCSVASVGLTPILAGTPPARRSPSGHLGQRQPSEPPAMMQVS
jgi:hypothetical protein